MIQSRIMNFIELSICVFVLWKTVDAQVNIPAVTPPRNGDVVTLICTISTFTLPAAWKNNDNSGTWTTCFSTGTCLPPSDGFRYNFLANSSSIIVIISNFSSTVDTFTWKCEHNGTAATYHITPATMITTTPNTAITTTPNTAITTTPNTSATKTANDTVTALPLSLHALKIGMAVGGSLLILLIIIICCCCCPCCYLYHCRKEGKGNKYGTDLEEINHNHNANETKTKLKDVTPNPGYRLSNTPDESSTYAASQTSTSQNSMSQF